MYDAFRKMVTTSPGPLILNLPSTERVNDHSVIENSILTRYILLFLNQNAEFTENIPC